RLPGHPVMGTLPRSGAPSAPGNAAPGSPTPKLRTPGTTSRVLDPYPSGGQAVDFRLMSAGLPYLRSRGRRWTALLLPALLLRAVIPFGFIPMVAGGGMTTGFCPGEADLPPGIAAAHHVDSHAGHSAAAHGGGGHAGDLGGGAHHAPCLFAVSASAAV